MLLGQIEGFVEVARRRNVTRAAEALAITQPALTARLKGLERELRTTLFVRTSHGIRLTEAGRAFLPYAERVADTVGEARNVMAGLGTGRAGKLALGAAPAVSTYVLPEILKRFRATHPNVKLSVRTGHSEEILDLVLREEVELGLIRTLRHPDIESLPLFDDELVLVADPQHRFAAAAKIRIEQIAEEQLIMFDRASSYTEQTAALFRDAGVVVRDVMELDNIDAAKKMVEQGLGVALLPRSAVRADLAAGALREVRITDTAPIRHRMVAVRRRDAGPAIGVVAEFLRVLAESAGGGLRASGRSA